MTTEQRNPIPALDGLRAIACYLVVITHIGEAGWSRHSTEIGTLGVMLFFTLSGFLMASLYLPGQKAPLYWLGFMIRRILRVYPAYAAIILALWAAHHGGMVTPLPEIEGRSLRSLLMMKNLGRPFWTVPVELRFYLWFALAAFVCARCEMSPRTLLMTALVVWAAFLFISTAPKFMGIRWFKYERAYYCFFVGGIVAAQLRGTLLAKRLSAAHAASICMGLLFAYLALRLGARKHFFFYTEQGQLWRQSLVLAPLMAIWVLALAADAGRRTSVLAFTPLRLLGKISFSIYLCHIYVEWTLAPMFTRYSLINYGFLMAMIALVSGGLFIAVERPFMRLGQLASRCLWQRSQPITH